MKKEYQLLLLILIVSFVIHISYINNGFIWLDHGDIESGRTILPVSQLSKAFFTRLGDTNFFRPLVTIFNSLDYSIYQQKAWGFHLTNLVLLLFVVTSTYFFSRKFFELTEKEGLFVSLTVGIHPLTILPAGAISYRQELLVTIFTFLAVAAYIEFRKTIKTAWFFAALSFWLFALFSKETALFWPLAFILIWEWTTGIKKKNLDLKQYISASFVLIFYLSLRYIALRQFWNNKNLSLNWSEALGTRLTVLFWRLIELINPSKPSFSDATKIVGINNLLSLSAIVILISALFLLVRGGRKTILARLILFIFFALLPSLSLIYLPRFSSPHYGFIAIPAAGVMLVIFFRKINHNLSRKTLMLFSAIGIIIMSINTFRAGYQFKDDYTFFKTEVERDGNFKEGHFYLGDYYLRQEDHVLAEKHLQAALKSDPKIIAFVDKNAAMTNLAGVYLAQEKYAEAEEMLLEIIKISSGKNKLLAIYNLAVVKERRGDYQGIIRLLKDTLNEWIQPQPVFLYVKALIKTGSITEAVNILKNKLKINEDVKVQEVIQSVLRF